MGIPQLSSSITVLVSIERKQLSNLPMAFEQIKFKAEIEENALGNTVVKKFSILNKPTSKSHLGSISCHIQSGNQLGHFYVRTTEFSDCELMTNGQKLDFESGNHYIIAISIQANNSQPIDPLKSIAIVTVTVSDVNDNRPSFTYDWPMHRLIGQQYVTAISRDAATSTPFAKISAVDADSGTFGNVVYKLIKQTDNNEISNYFAIDYTTGLLSNLKTFERLSPNVTSFQLTVLVRDNPKSSTNYLQTTTNVTVNLISDEHRLVLVIMDVQPDQVARQKLQLIDMLQQNTNYVINVEKIESRKYVNNSKLQSDAGGSDIWINAIDPKTLSTVTVSDQHLQTFFLNGEQKQTLLYSMSAGLEVKFQSINFYSMEMHQKSTTKANTMEELEMDNGFQVALIALAGLIAVGAFIAIVYLCVIWTRFVSYRDQLRRLSLVPKYDQHVLYEPNLKPYETQVLRMNMHNDDSSSVEGSYMPFDLNGPIDDLSFLTKGMGDMSTLEAENLSSESDSLEIGDASIFSPSVRSRERVTFADVLRPAQNPVYHSSDDANSSPTEEVISLPRPHLRHSSTPMVTTEL
ncbi:hypothetical protein CHUAL_007227 [Chamberlinius hualienensis]